MPGGHLKQHSFTGTTDHDFTGLIGGELLQFDGTNVVSSDFNSLGIVTGSGVSNYVTKWDNTGMGLTGSSIIDNGTSIVFNENGADIDFRIETPSYPNMFVIDGGTERVGIGASSSSGFVDITNQTANGTIVRAYNDNASSYALRVFTSGGSVMNSFRNSGRVDLATTGGVTYMGDQASNYLQQNVQVTTQFSNTATRTGFVADRDGTKLALESITSSQTALASTGDFGIHTNWNGNFASSTGDLVMNFSNERRVGVGLASILTEPSARMHIIGLRDDSAGDTLLLQGSGGTATMVVEDGGNVGIGTSAPGALLDVRGSATFNEGGIDADFRIESDLETNMFMLDGGFNTIGVGTAAVAATKFGVNSSNESAITNIINVVGTNIGTNGNGIGVNVTSTVGESRGVFAQAISALGSTTRSIYGLAWGVASANNYAVYGTARNGTTSSIGVYGTANGGGGSSGSGATYTAGVQGDDSTNLIGATSEKRAGYFAVSNGSDGQTSYGVKTLVAAGGHDTTQYGIHSSVSINGSVTGATAVGGYFTTSNAGTGGISYGILVPDTNDNSGFGTATPAERLHVVGSIRMVDTSEGTGNIIVGDVNGTMAWSGTSDLALTKKFAGSSAFTTSVALQMDHNLGTTDVIVQLKDSTGQLVIPDTVDNYQTNSVDITVSTTATYRVIIIG